MKHLQDASFSPTVDNAKGGDEGESKHDDSKETMTEKDLAHGFPPRRQFLRDLSRVSEEASMSRASSSTSSCKDLGGRFLDEETGGSKGMQDSDDSSRDDNGPDHITRFLPRWATGLGRKRRSPTTDGLERINETREHSGQRKSRNRGRFPASSPFTTSPSIVSFDDSSEGEEETSTTSRSMPRSALPLSSASSSLRTIPPHRLSRSLSRAGPTRGGVAKSEEGDSRGTVPTELRTLSPLHDVRISSRAISRRCVC